MHAKVSSAQIMSESRQDFSSWKILVADFKNLTSMKRKQFDTLFTYNFTTMCQCMTSPPRIGHVSHAQISRTLLWIECAKDFFDYEFNQQICGYKCTEKSSPAARWPLVASLLVATWWWQDHPCWQVYWLRGDCKPPTCNWDVANILMWSCSNTFQHFCIIFS